MKRYTIQIQYEEGGEFIPQHNVDTTQDVLFLLWCIMESGEYIAVRLKNWKINRTVDITPF